MLPPNDRWVNSNSQNSPDPNHLPMPSMLGSLMAELNLATPAAPVPACSTEAMPTPVTLTAASEPAQKVSPKIKAGSNRNRNRNRNSNRNRNPPASAPAPKTTGQFTAFSRHTPAEPAPVLARPSKSETEAYSADIHASFEREDDRSGDEGIRNSEGGGSGIFSPPLRPQPSQKSKPGQNAASSPCLPAAQAPAAVARSMSDDTLKSKLASLFTDWMSAKSEANAVTSWADLKEGGAGDGLGVDFMTSAVERVANCSNLEDRMAIAELARVLAAEGLVRSSDLRASLRVYVKLLEDNSYDIPSLHANLACLYGPLAAQGFYRMVKFEKFFAYYHGSNVIDGSTITNFFDALGKRLLVLGTEDARKAASQAQKVRDASVKRENDKSSGEREQGGNGGGGYDEAATGTSAEVVFNVGDRVQARYSLSSRYWKCATVLSIPSKGDPMIWFDGYDDALRIPLVRIRKMQTEWSSPQPAISTPLPQVLDHRRETFCVSIVETTFEKALWLMNFEAGRMNESSSAKFGNVSVVKKGSKLEVHVRNRYKKEHLRMAAELEVALREAEANLKVSEAFSLRRAVADELWNDIELKRLEAEERVFVIRPAKKGTATASTNTPTVLVRLVSDATSDLARVQEYLNEKYASVESEIRIGGDGVGDGSSSVTSEFTDINFKIKMLLLGTPGHYINGSDFKPKWQKFYGTDLVLPKGAKLRQFLKGPEVAGACRLEMCKMPNGTNSLTVHAPADGEGHDQTAFGTSAEFVNEVRDRVHIKNNISNARLSQQSTLDLKAAHDPHPPSAPAPVVTHSAKAETEACLSEDKASVERESGKSGGEGGKDDIKKSDHSMSLPSSSGNAKELQWSELKVGKLVGKGSFGQVNYSLAAYVSTVNTREVFKSSEVSRRILRH